MERDTFRFVLSITRATDVESALQPYFARMKEMKKKPTSYHVKLQATDPFEETIVECIPKLYALEDLCLSSREHFYAPRKLFPTDWKALKHLCLERAVLPADVFCDLELTSATLKECACPYLIIPPSPQQLKGPSWTLVPEFNPNATLHHLTLDTPEATELIFASSLKSITLQNVDAILETLLDSCQEVPKLTLRQCDLALDQANGYVLFPHNPQVHVQQCIGHFHTGMESAVEEVSLDRYDMVRDYSLFSSVEKMTLTLHNNDRVIDLTSCKKVSTLTLIGRVHSRPSIEVSCPPAAKKVDIRNEMQVQLFKCPTHCEVTTHNGATVIVSRFVTMTSTDGEESDMEDQTTFIDDGM